MCQAIDLNSSVVVVWYFVASPYLINYQSLNAAGTHYHKSSGCEQTHRFNYEKQQSKKTHFGYYIQQKE